MTPKAVPTRQGIRIVEMDQVMNLGDERHAERQGEKSPKRRVKNLDRVLAADGANASLALEFFYRLGQRIPSQLAKSGASEMCLARETGLQFFKCNLGDEERQMKLP